MQTIKIQHKGEGQRIVQTDDEVTILREGDHEYRELCIQLEKSHKESQVSSAYEKPFAIICYETPECSHKSYMYDDDRAWIMNANGKTVATV